MFLRIVFPYQLCMINVCKHGPKSLIALLSWPNPKKNIFPRHSYTENFPKPNDKCVKHGLICIQVAIKAKSSWRSFTGMLSIATGCPIRAAIMQQTAHPQYFTNQLIHLPGSSTLSLCKSGFEMEEFLKRSRMLLVESGFISLG